MNIELDTHINSDFVSAIGHLTDLSNINSGSRHTEGLASTAEALSELFSPIGSVSLKALANFTSISDLGEEHQVPVGDLIEVKSRFNKGPEVLLVSHYDTVFDRDHPFQVPMTSGSRMIGPGVADAKGGLVMLWMALRALQKVDSAVNWRLLIVPDEEIGSPGSAPLLRAAAAGAAVGLGFEPSLPDGSMAAVRPGSGTFTVRVSGRAAHAGRALAHGRNAIVEAASLMEEIESLNEHTEVLANPAFIRGGGPTNIVPDFALVRFNVRPTTPQAQAWAVRKIDAAVESINRKEGFSAVVNGGFNRSPKQMNPRYRRLLDFISARATAIGMTLGSSDTGGVCDGNVLAEAGLTNVDNLGPTGGNLHSDGEYVELDTLCQRALLTADVMTAITSSESF